MNDQIIPTSRLRAALQDRLKMERGVRDGTLVESAVESSNGNAPFSR